MPLRPFLPLLFFATGAAGLIYEVVWFRLLESIFGVTTLATSTVLAVFMGGLAIGAHLASRRADHLRNPVRTYGLLELALAALAFLIPWSLPLANRVFVFVYDALNPSFAVLSVMRLLASAVVLLPPAALMGMTLPILTKAFARRGDEGADVSFLYTINTAGALLGAAVGGLFLLPQLGMRTTAWIAVGLNVLAGATAILLSGTQKRGAWGALNVGDTEEESGAPPWGAAAAGVSGEPPRGTAAAGSEAARAPGAARDEAASEVGSAPSGAPSGATGDASSLFLLAGLSGLCALAYQIFWTRALLLSIGNTVYAFTVILVTVLAGITAGSGLSTLLLKRVQSPLRLLAATQMAAALLVVALTASFDDFPALFLQLSSRWGDSWTGFLGASFTLAALGLFPATLLLGMGLPLVLAAAVDKNKGVARQVGRLYSVNTWAGIFGSILAGFILIPLAGIRNGLLVMAALNGFAGLVAWHKSSTRAASLLVPGGFVALFAALVALFPPWDRSAMTSGLHTSGNTNAATADDRLIYYREGIAATVSVKQRGRDLKLQVNGRTEATSIGDLKTNTLLGGLAPLLRPGAKSAVVIGLGSGVTLAGVVPHPLESIECIELCDEVVEASRFFAKAAGDATQDPRVVLRAEDGRNHLLLTQRKYDVIISQPSNLWAAGVGNLFTREFFELCAARLEDDGILCQWIQGYSVSKSSLRSILATMQEVFPSVDLWLGEWSDLLVTASKTETPLSVEALEEAFADPKVGASLQRAGIGDVPTLLSHHLLDAAAIQLYAKGARIHTDDNRLVEFGEPRSLAEGTATSQTQDLLAWKTDVRERLGKRRGASAGPGGSTTPADSAFDAALAGAVRARSLEVEARGKEASGRGAEAVQLLREAMAANPNDGAVRRNLARLHVRMGVEFARQQDYPNAYANFEAALSADSESAEAAGNFGVLALVGGNDTEAVRWTQRALDLDPENETYFAQLAEIHRRAGRWPDSKSAAQKALALDPRSIQALLLLAEAQAYLNDPEGAVDTLEEARRLGAPHEEMTRVKKLVRQDG